MDGLDAMYAPFRYGDPVRSVIHRLQFDHESRAAELLAPRMADALKRRDFDCIVPVPLHKKRFRLRGYNQSALLAERLSALTGIPVREDLLIRSRSTRAQSSLSREKRPGNVENAFIASDAVSGMRLLLLDDVRTSGSTARACASALRHQGAASVSLITAALVWTWAEHEIRTRKQKTVHKNG